MVMFALGNWTATISEMVSSNPIIRKCTKGNSIEMFKKKRVENERRPTWEGKNSRC